MSPGRRCIPRTASASSQTSSSSARPTTSARTPSSMTSLIDTTSPVSSGARASTTLKLSLRTTSLPRSSCVEVDVGVRRDLHLAAAREDVDRAVVVLADDHAVGRRRLGELVDLVAQGGDVLARLPQRVAELLVLGHRLGELALRLEQALLEGPDPLRARRPSGCAGERSRRSARRPAHAGPRCSRHLSRARWAPSVALAGNLHRRSRRCRGMFAARRSRADDMSVSTLAHRVKLRASSAATTSDSTKGTTR